MAVWVLLLAIAGVVSAKDLVVGEAELVTFMKKAVLDQKEAWKNEVKDEMATHLKGHGEPGSPAAVDDEVVVELRQENQELHERIIDLKKQLQAFIGQTAEVEAPPAASTSGVLAPRRANTEQQEVATAISDASMWMQKDDAKVVLGEQADTTLRRDGAGVLKTDGTFAVGADLAVDGSVGVGTDLDVKGSVKVEDDVDVVGDLQVGGTFTVGAHRKQFNWYIDNYNVNDATYKVAEMWINQHHWTNMMGGVIDIAVHHPTSHAWARWNLAAGHPQFTPELRLVGFDGYKDIAPRIVDDGFAWNDTSAPPGGPYPIKKFSVYVDSEHYRKFSIKWTSFAPSNRVDSPAVAPNSGTINFITAPDRVDMGSDIRSGGAWGTATYKGLDGIFNTGYFGDNVGGAAKLNVASTGHQDGVRITRPGSNQDLILGLTEKRITMGSSGEARSAFAIQSDEWSAGNGFTAMQIANNGHVGVGTTSPKGTLHIVNTAEYNDLQDTTGQDSIILHGSLGNKNGKYSGGITWCNGASCSRRRAGIATVMEHTDADYVGISFFTKGTDGPGKMHETMRLKHNGNLQLMSGSFVKPDGRRLDEQIDELQGSVNELRRRRRLRKDEQEAINQELREQIASQATELAAMREAISALKNDA